MDQWFEQRDVEEAKINAFLWKDCNTTDARKNHVFQTLVH